MKADFFSWTCQLQSIRQQQGCVPWGRRTLGLQHFCLPLPFSLGFFHLWSVFRLGGWSLLVLRSPGGLNYFGFSEQLVGFMPPLVWLAVLCQSLSPTRLSLRGWSIASFPLNPEHRENSFLCSRCYVLSLAPETNTTCAARSTLWHHLLLVACSIINIV